MNHSLCGQCLHSIENHTPDNGFFMYCSACQGLCSVDEYNIIHKPSDISTVMQLAVKREYNEYTPKEIKKNE